MLSSYDKIWNDFCTAFQIKNNGLKLFDTKEDLTVNVKLYGSKPERPVLKRNPELDNRFLKFCREIEESPENFDGILYLMYKERDDQIKPLYVGKTETYGKKGNISSLIKGTNIPR